MPCRVKAQSVAPVDNYICDYPNQADHSLADNDAGEERSAPFEQAPPADLQYNSLQHPADKKRPPIATHQPGAYQHKRQRMQRESRQLEPQISRYKYKDESEEEKWQETIYKIGREPFIPRR